ncbi:hypothetical protein, partial [Niabella drilacis]|uniref:hypothetical protein n=1 Tax=Niabella drilacis (strain DSM 25811 / CCM 8410 / CCUG 62505 / LMG 26954 / E90) TaxID=1285928 RepID=UPI001C40A736
MNFKQALSLRPVLRVKISLQYRRQCFPFAGVASRPGSGAKFLIQLYPNTASAAASPVLIAPSINPCQSAR